MTPWRVSFRAQAVCWEDCEMCVGPSVLGRSVLAFVPGMQRLMANCACRGRPLRGGLLVFVVWTLAGCGDDDLAARYRVMGRVTRQGQPVTKGTINFLPVELQKGRAATG